MAALFAGSGFAQTANVPGNPEKLSNFQTTEDVPNLAGETNICIDTRLKAFRSGKRVHEVMSVIAADCYASVKLTITPPRGARRFSFLQTARAARKQPLGLRGIAQLVEHRSPNRGSWVRVPLPLPGHFRSGAALVQSADDLSANCEPHPCQRHRRLHLDFAGCGEGAGAASRTCPCGCSYGHTTHV